MKLHTLQVTRGKGLGVKESKRNKRTSIKGGEEQKRHIVRWWLVFFFSILRDWEQFKLKMKGYSKFTQRKQQNNLKNVPWTTPEFQNMESVRISEPAHPETKLKLEIILASWS